MQMYIPAEQLIMEAVEGLARHGRAHQSGARPLFHELFGVTGGDQ
jgi:hypothetical protein